MVAYAFILSSSKLHSSLTGLAVYAGEGCRATAEMTLSLQIDLVLNDMAATGEP